MTNNCGLHSRYYAGRVLEWAKDNKIILLLGTLSFCLFVSTLTLASQRNRTRQDIDDLKETIPDCHLSLKSDFTRPAPVFLRNGTFLAPNPTTGEITLRRSETIIVACPGDNRRISLANQTTSYDVLEAHCVVDSTFRVDRWIGPFQQINCNTQPWVSTEQVKGGCLGGNELHRVGYKVKRTFHELYQACFDPESVETLYVKHRLAPSSLFVQPDRRPSFFEGNLFKNVQMAELYKMKNQQERMRDILGSDADNYISDKEYLTRGHLAPRADFSLSAEQRASFHYVNTAPQWRAANSGAWAAVEDGLRRRINVLGRPLTVYTGTFGVSSLNGQPLYLTDDENNNGLVPVPMYFYKLVYDDLTKTAVTFVSINRSSLNSSTTPEAPCRSSCDYYPWLRQRGAGSACCEYDALGAARLPQLQVEGLLVL